MSENNVYTLRGLRQALYMLKIKERDSVIPITQEYKYYDGSGNISVGYVIEERDYPVFFKGLIDGIVEVSKDGGDVEEYLKDVKKKVRMCQRAWSGVFGEERGNIVRGNSRVERPLKLHGMVDNSRVPFEVIMYVCFGVKLGDNEDGVIEERDRSLMEFIKGVDEEWVKERSGEGVV